ncbi:MAG TPA: phosphorylase [Myxococcota bacterium]|nr:phosphorylase [Myxococcota bacterium]
MKVALRRGSLWPAIRTRTAAALESGALVPIGGELDEIEERGIRFQVRLATALERKRAVQATRAPDFDPFLPVDPALFVADVSEDYVCVLNKFPALRHHALLTTREFEEQETPLRARDFEVLWLCLAERDALAFYNSSAKAGGSERHRHLQLVPPLVAGAATVPIDTALEAARFDGPVGSAPGLPFLHAFARLRDLSELPCERAAQALASLYREMARAFGCERPGRPYNLLLTREWMLFVPRARERFEGISINALGFAGALLVRDRDALARLRTAGPLAALRQVGVSG